jgi:hypothetical protein
MGIVVAYVVAMFLLAVPAVAYAGHPLGINAPDVIRIVWRQLVGALAATAIGFLLRYYVLTDVSAIVRTIVLGLTYLLTYSIIVIGILKVRGPVRMTQTLVRGYLAARFAHLLG